MSVRLSDERCGELLEGLATGALEHDVLKQEVDSRTLRLHCDPRSSVIVKLWARPGLRGLVRRLTRTDPASREHAALARLQDAGIPVPTPMALYRPRIAGIVESDAFFMEDLGPCCTALDHLKKLIEAGDEDRVAGFVDSILDLTEAVLAAGILDTDHHLNNMVVTESGRLVRLDTELARPVRRRPPALYGEMLGRLTGSMMFAVQPDLDRVVSFARALDRRLALSKEVKQAMSAQVDRMTEHQIRNTGRVTRVDLAW